MNNLLEFLKNSGISIQEFNLIEQSDAEFWHSLFIQNSRPISGGFGSSKEQARKIAYAEFLERRKYREIFSDKNEGLRKEWGIDLIPTACGFAAGFDKTNTINRSLNEALERWVMSKWIDDHFFIPKCHPNFEVSEASNLVCKWFSSQFDEVLFFEKEITVLFLGEFKKVKVAQTMGLKDSGIYPGSSAQTSNGNIWTHALLESFRHLLIIKNGADFSKFPHDKVKYFSKNASLALKSIDSATKNTWPIPHVKFFNYEYFPAQDYHLSRVIIDGWKSWDEGPLERFLY